MDTQISTKINYDEIANDILAILNDFKFTTDTQFDPNELKSKIIQAIRVKIETDNAIIPLVALNPSY